MVRVKADQIRKWMEPFVNVLPALAHAAEIIESAEDAERVAEALERDHNKRIAALKQEIKELETKQIVTTERTKQLDELLAKTLDDVTGKINLVNASLKGKQAEHVQQMERMESERNVRARDIDHEQRKLQTKLTETQQDTEKQIRDMLGTVVEEHRKAIAALEAPVKVKEREVHEA